jgi:transposase
MAKRLFKGSERLRGKIMELVKQGHKTLKAASLEAGIGYRQAKRVYRRYLEDGDEALIHGNTGKPSNRRTDPDLVRQALALYAEKYDDFGPTLVCEKLAEQDGVAISVSTLRRELTAAGLWRPERKGRSYHSRRAARDHFGELSVLTMNRTHPPKLEWILPEWRKTEPAY